MRSLPHAVTLTMPISVTPMPKCANAVPQAERGNPTARRSAARNGTRRIERALGNIGYRAGHHEDGDADAEWRQHRAAMFERKCRRGCQCREHRRCKEPLRGAQQIAALPAHQRSEWHDRHQRDE